MLNKEELGLKIKEARKIKSKELGIKYTGKMLADSIGISRGYLGDIENGRIYPNYEILTKIADACNLPLDFFQNNKRNESNITLTDATPMEVDDIVNIPIVGTIRAGQPILAIENIEGYFPAFKNHLSTDKEYFFLRVKGDSMNLEFQEGDLLLIEKCPCLDINGRIAVVLIDGLEATVKKVVKNDNMITLIPMSSNPSHIPQMYDIKKELVQVIGLVKMAIKSY